MCRRLWQQSWSYNAVAGYLSVARVLRACSHGYELARTCVTETVSVLVTFISNVGHVML